MALFRSDGWVKNVLGQALAGAQVYVCSQPADVTYVPPIPLASIFSDPNGVTAITQPVATDGFGHYDFYVSNGTYTVIIVTGGKIQQVYTDQTIGFPTAVSGVSSVFGRTGDVLAQSGDYSAFYDPLGAAAAAVVGLAPLSSPAFSGIPTAPTAPLATGTNQVATCAFVLANAAGGAVSSVFGRTGAVTAQSGDYSVAQITGAAPLVSPTFSGNSQAANLSITGTLKDSSGSVGTSGQLLSSTVTGTAWITAPSNTPTFAFQPTIVPPGNVSSWANKHDTGGTGVFTDLTNAVMILSPGYTGSNQLHKTLTNAAPATAFTLTAAFFANFGNCGSSNYPNTFVLIQGTGTAFVLFGPIYGSGPPHGLWVGAWNSYTSQASDRKAPYFIDVATLVWIKVQYDGTNLIYSVSTNGEDWIQQFSETATNFIGSAPAYVGFGANSYTSTSPTIVTLVHWNVTTP